mgnify:CR=1 FL=1
MKKYILILIAVFTTIAAIPAVHFLQSRMEDSIRDNHLMGEKFAKEGGAPPGIAVSTVFLGAFRSVFSNALWFRMTRLQEKGRYYEMVQLADWILSVQPDNSMVAQFLGWNMAYNISVIHQDKETRWRWINKGIDALLYAIELSPHDQMIYRELSWIYMHKLGDQMDDGNLYYKYMLANNLYPLYGNSHKPDWKALEKAPADKKAFMKKYPENTKLWFVLNANGYADFDQLYEKTAPTSFLPEPVHEALGEETAADIENALRRIRLKKIHRLEPGHALEIEEKYGDFDWLLPETLGIYWADLGIKMNSEENSKPCKRIVAQCLKISFLSGRIRFPNGTPSREFLRFPNVSVFNSTVAMYTDLRGTDPIPGVDMGLSSFLLDAIDILYLYGKTDLAEKGYKQLMDLGYSNPNNFGLNDFMNIRLRKIINDGSYNQVQYLIVLFIERTAYALADGEHDEAERHLAFAKQIYELYEKRNADIKEQGRLNMPPFQEFLRLVIGELRKQQPALSRALDAELFLQEQNTRKP